MGCASSKNIGATSPRTKAAALDVYRHPPSGFAVFDINSIEEPWLKLESAFQFQAVEKPSIMPAPLLEKLNDDDATPPQSWDVISKALDDFKTNPPPLPPVVTSEEPMRPESTMTMTVYKAPESKPELGLKKLKPVRFEEDENPVRFGGGSEGFRSLRDNPFIMKDKIESAKEGKESFLERLVMLRRDPLGGFPEKCPPGGTARVVLYTTSLGGIRKTFEECNRARSILELHRVVFDERDVSLHGEFRNELRELVDEVAVPRLFIHGRYIGGLDELLELNETGKLVRILSWARVERGIGWKGCEGCGGARFVPCMDCGGSCKVVVAGQRERCSTCNENGLTPCPLCH